MYARALTLSKARARRGGASPGLGEAVRGSASAGPRFSGTHAATSVAVPAEGAEPAERVVADRFCAASCAGRGSFGYRGPPGTPKPHAPYPKGVPAAVVIPGLPASNRAITAAQPCVSPLGAARATLAPTKPDAAINDPAIATHAFTFAMTAPFAPLERAVHNDATTRTSPSRRPPFLRGAVSCGRARDVGPNPRIMLVR
jgi:hypothetical protein